MKRFCFLLFLFLMTSCFLMPLGAPHYHQYNSYNKNFVINVFCTPRHKTYYFSFNENSKVKGCSKIFIENSCLNFEIDSFFEEEKFQKTIRIGDKKFHKLFEEDTLKISIDDSLKVIELLPVK